MFIATKFNAEGGRGIGGMPSFERSLARLEVDSVDLMFIHSIDSVEPLISTLIDWAEDLGAGSWAEVFVKYAVSHPAVTCAIPGTDDVEHAEENMRAGRGRLPDAATRREIERFWDQLA